MDLMESPGIHAIGSDGSDGSCMDLMDLMESPGIHAVRNMDLMEQCIGIPGDSLSLETSNIHLIVTSSL